MQTLHQIICVLTPYYSGQIFKNIRQKLSCIQVQGYLLGNDVLEIMKFISQSKPPLAPLGPLQDTGHKVKMDAQSLLSGEIRSLAIP